VSQFFYADDAVFLSDWSLENAKHVLRILRCFFMASSLKINLHKSKLIGVGVSFDRVKHVAMEIGCAAVKPPFVYLGLPVGKNMSRVQAWKTLRDRFITKLSLEALRSHFFCAADIGERKLHWVNWSRILVSKDDGGLGVGSLSSFNKAKLFKWRWRFFHSPNALWVFVIKAIHGTSGRCSDLSTVGTPSGPWKGIVTVIR